MFGRLLIASLDEQRPLLGFLRDVRGFLGLGYSISMRIKRRPRNDLLGRLNPSKSMTGLGDLVLIVLGGGLGGEA